MDKIVTVSKRLQGSRVYFDTNPIIYFVEQNNAFAQAVAPLFELIGTGHISAYTSEFTLAEILIKPSKDNLQQVVMAHKELLLDPDLFTLTKTHRDLFVNAAELAGSAGLRLPDAIHMASALENHCHYFITNDKRIKDYKTVAVVQLGDLI